MGKSVEQLCVYVAKSAITHYEHMVAGFGEGGNSRDELF